MFSFRASTSLAGPVGPVRPVSPVADVDDLEAELEAALDTDNDLPNVPPAGVPPETDFFRDIRLDMFVLTSSLAVNASNKAAVERIVLQMSKMVIETGAAQALENELETELAGGKAKRNTRRNTQTLWHIAPNAVVAMRHKDYTTGTNIRRGNFKNAVTVRKVTADFDETARKLKGPTIKFFKNGRIQASGWKTVASFEDFTNSVADRLGLPAVDPSKNAVSLVNGSARIKTVPGGRMVLATLAEKLRAIGYSVDWNPTTGNNGLKVQLVDEVAASELRSKKVDMMTPVNRKLWERGAMIFSNGYVKMFSRGEDQLARLVPLLSDALEAVFTE